MINFQETVRRLRRRLDRWVMWSISSAYGEAGIWGGDGGEELCTGWFNLIIHKENII